MSKLICALFIVAFSHSAISKSETENQIEKVSGAWLGQMNIPNGPSLRIGIEVFKKADGSWGGNIASLDQGARYMLVEQVSLENSVFTLQMAGAPVSVVGSVDSDYNVIQAKFNQGNSAFDLELNKVESLPEIERPQTPADNTAYAQHDIKFENKVDNTWLSGTLTIPKPKLKQKHPAIVLVAGSGPNHRDSYHAGHRTFKVIADHFTKLGYAVLRSDKRGVYKSGGRFEDANLNNLVLDAQAAVQYMKSHKNVDANNIVLIGHSEGSLVSIMATAKESVKGIVSLAGPGMSVLDILLLQDQTEPSAKGATKPETDILLEFSKRFYCMVLNTPESEVRKEKALALYDGLKGKEAEVVAKWVDKNNGTLSINSAASDAFYEFLQQDPLPYWNQFKGNALILNGEKDSQVPSAQNVSGILNAITHKEAQVQSETFATLNHLFQPAKTGATDEYGKIDITIDEQVLHRIAKWLEESMD